MCEESTKIIASVGIFVRTRKYYYVCTLGKYLPVRFKIKSCVDIKKSKKRLVIRDN